MFGSLIEMAPGISATFSMPLCGRKSFGTDGRSPQSNPGRTKFSRVIYILRMKALDENGNANNVFTTPFSYVGN